MAAKDAVEKFQEGDFIGSAISAIGTLPGFGLAGRFAKKGMGLFSAKQAENTIVAALIAAKRTGDPKIIKVIDKRVDQFAKRLDTFLDVKKRGGMSKGAIEIEEATLVRKEADLFDFIQSQEKKVIKLGKPDRTLEPALTDKLGRTLRESSVARGARAGRTRRKNLDDQIKSLEDDIDFNKDVLTGGETRLMEERIEELIRERKRLGAVRGVPTSEVIIPDFTKKR